MGSGSASWNLKKCIMRYSQKRLRTFSCRGKRGSCVYAGDFSSEMSNEFQPSKRSLTSELLINKQFPDSLKDNPSSTLPAAVPFTLIKDENLQECEQKAEIGPQVESQKETYKLLVGDSGLASDHMQQPEAHDEPKHHETQGRLLAQDPQKRRLKPVIFMIHGPEIMTERNLQTESCEPETEGRTADYEDLTQERSYKPTIAPEPKKGILKPGFTIVHESEVSSEYKVQTDCATESGAPIAEESESSCNHLPAETTADGDCESRSSVSQQKTNSDSDLISVAPRSAGDLCRSFGLIKVPPSRGTSPWSPPSPTAQSAHAAPPQVQSCSHCRFAHNFGTPPRLLKAEQIKLATDNFCKKNFLDDGEWEFVYKGCLEGQPVAIKTITHDNSLDKFSAEIAVLTSLQHPNVVSLVGYCLEDNDRALVYNYVCNRSLYWHLSCISNETKFMAWTIRKTLAVNVARGLLYLHSEVRGGGVIHGDIRSRNIFLNHDMVPVIGGFGQSRWQESGLNPLTSRPKQGYPGYVAPEYLEGGQISEKVDVYAFGIVLLELMTGRKAIDRLRPEEQRHLVDWARPWLESPTDYDTLKTEMLDAQLMVNGQECSEGDVMSTIHAARLCLRKDPLKRPRMSQVLDILANNDHNHFQESSCSSFVKSSTVAAGNDSALAIINRTAQSAALATLRALDPAEMRSSLAPRHCNNSEDTQFHSAPSTPDLNELVRRDTDFAVTVSSRRSSSSSGAGPRKGSGKVTQLLYQPLHYLTSSSSNKPRHRVSFTKGTTTRLFYNDLLGHS